MAWPLGLCRSQLRSGTRAYWDPPGPPAPGGPLLIGNVCLLFYPIFIYGSPSPPMAVGVMKSTSSLFYCLFTPETTEFHFSDAQGNGSLDSHTAPGKVIEFLDVICVYHKHNYVFGLFWGLFLASCVEEQLFSSISIVSWHRALTFLQSQLPRIQTPEACSSTQLFWIKKRPHSN